MSPKGSKKVGATQGQVMECETQHAHRAVRGIEGRMFRVLLHFRDDKLSLLHLGDSRLVHEQQCQFLSQPRSKPSDVLELLEEDTHLRQPRQLHLE